MLANSTIEFLERTLETLEEEALRRVRALSSERAFLLLSVGESPNGAQELLAQILSAKAKVPVDNQE